MLGRSRGQAADGGSVHKVPVGEVLGTKGISSLTNVTTPRRIVEATERGVACW